MWCFIKRYHRIDIFLILSMVWKHHFPFGVTLDCIGNQRSFAVISPALKTVNFWWFLPKLTRCFYSPTVCSLYFQVDSSSFIRTVWIKDMLILWWIMFKCWVIGPGRQLRWYTGLVWVRPSDLSPPQSLTGVRRSTYLPAHSFQAHERF